MKKRILCIMLALCMALCLVPTVAFAADQTANSWSSLQDLINKNSNLSVTLTQDITWGGSSLTIPAGKTVTLDLNGKSVDAQNNGTVFVVNGTLTIRNSGADLPGFIGAGAGPIGGNIKNGISGEKEAGGIFVEDGGKLVMNSGWITNCSEDGKKLSAAGAVYVSENAEFEMTGGIITGCTGGTLFSAGGVVNYGTFIMSKNATISGSKTNYGTGVAVCNFGTFNANGGTVQTSQICNNSGILQSSSETSTIFYSDVLNTGFGTILGGTFEYPVENAGKVFGGTYNSTTTGIFTVKFNSNGGSSVPSQIRGNAPATKPANPSRDGYTFLGWFNGDAQWDFGTDVTENITLTAQWKKLNYNVTLNTNRGTIANGKNVTRYTEGVGATLPTSADITRTGYTFGGWYANSSFSGSPVTAISSTDTGDKTFYAKWTPKQYTVTFDPSGGSCDMTAKTVTYDAAYGELPVPTLEGYTFKGWYTERTDSKKVSSTSVVDRAENFTLYAHWSINQYTITFDTDGGTEVAPITQDHGTPITRPADPTKNGYIFDSWDGLPTNMPARNLTVKAFWREKSDFSVKFITGVGAEIINKGSVHWRDTILDTVNTPKKDGYVFIGWMCGNTEVTADTTYADLAVIDTVTSLTITAQWSEKSNYTISFDTVNGSEISDKTNLKWTDKVLDGVTVPTRSGWQFDGWKCGNTAVTADTTYADLAENDGVTSVTLTAQWKDIEEPTGEISIGTNKWREFLNKLTFGLFFKDTQSVTITAADNSGTVDIGYYVTDRDLTKAQLSSVVFRDYNGSFNIDKNGKYIVYVKLTDKSLNTTYLRSDGVTFDNASPVIGGIEDGKTYCEAQTVTVTEDNIDKVKVNGTEVALDGNNQFVLSPKSRAQIIVVTDKAGNSTEMTVTVNDGHTALADDGDCTTPIYCKFCNAEVVVAKQHDFTGKWHNDKSSHWHECLNENCTVTDTKIAHSGSDDGDCTTAVTCECGYVITAAKSEHTWGPWTSDGNDKHTRKCTVNGCTKGTQTENCSGGEATCKDKAECEICHEKYGATDPDNHTGTLGWNKTATTHEKKWDCCQAVDVAKENHEWKNGTCTECGYICTHTGGEATCKDKAECETCHEKYGEIDPKNHSDLTRTPAKAATKDAEGNIEYRHCGGCDKYYSDAAATNEITKADTVTKKLPADQKSPQTDSTTKSTQTDSTTKSTQTDSTTKSTQTDSTDKSPQTGDKSNLALWIALLFVSGGAVVGTAVVSKKKKRSVK